tara:strand:- start:253 stop:1239 length:987 start_codon:yes stop_codon:yes gene_type:complete
MIHPWYLGPQPEEIENIMELCLSKNNDEKVAKMLLLHTQKIEKKLPQTLFKIIIRGLTLCLEQPSHQTSEFLCEICAAYEFQYKNKEAGKISETLNSISKNPYLAHYLVEKCNEIKEKNPKNGNQWFNIRICVMDICTASKMLESSTNWNVFYGGETHAKNIGKILSIEGICNSTNEPDELDYIKNYVESCSTIETIPKDKKYTLLGEKHSETSIDFATKLLEFCNEKCNGSERVSLFVEKHPSNGIDFVQQNLTCNLQKSVSIQKFRCNYPKCDNVKVYDVDVRHVELGFLRYEFLCLDYDDQFQNLSYDFQEECINHLKSIGIIMM